MILRIIFFVVVVPLGLFGIFKWALFALKKAEIDERIDTIDENEKLYKKVNDVDILTSREEKKVVEDFMNETKTF